MKVAKLVNVSFVIRVIVEDNYSDEKIIEMAIPKISEKILNELNENVWAIEDDIECPFGTLDKDFKL